MNERSRWSLATHSVAGLPRLGWVLAAAHDRPAAGLFHGPAVETGDGWAVEGVWDGDFGDAAFDQAEHFFGSGVRCVDGRLTFVPSSALVDRILVADDGRRLFASNSLPLLLAATRARLDPSHDYEQEAKAILAGVRDYRPEFHVVDAPGLIVRQVYHDPVTYAPGGAITRHPRGVVREFASFEDYEQALARVLGRVLANARAAERRAPMDTFTTLSSGYDSTAVATLARRLDVRRCFASRKSNTLLPEWIGGVGDDGTTAARVLGLEISEIELRPDRISEDEIHFFAAAPFTFELVFHQMAKAIGESGRPALVLTGYHGDKVWDAGTAGKYLDDQIRRGDVSGLGLSEIRLAAGFVNVAVPFAFARSVASLRRIAMSPEMAPWRLGSSYDRPIPRRIAETAGIPRESFGRRKRAVVTHQTFPYNRKLRADYRRFLRRTMRISPEFIGLRAVLNGAAYRAARLQGYARAMLSGRKPSDPAFAQLLHTPRERLWKEVRPWGLLHLWAVERLGERYARALEGTMPSD